MTAAIDTNVVLRLLVADDAVQVDLAREAVRLAFQGGEPVMVLLGTVLEMEWVLRSRYGYGRLEVASAIAALLESGDVCFEHERTVEEALRNWDTYPHVEFADCLLSARAAQLGCVPFITFDRRAASLPGARLLA